MKRVLTVALALLGLWGLLHWPVRTRQGVNYTLTEQTIPLHLKLGRFIYRDAEYRALVRTVTKGLANKEARVLALYDWVRAHLHSGIPQGLPVMDDHVWHIIVRGYGTADQLADVLATLCAYAGVPAELVFLGPPGGRSVHAVTLVRVEGRWCPVDPYYGVMARHPDGRLASREEILADPELVRRYAPSMTVRGVEYAQLYRWMPDVSRHDELRPYRHHPFMRAWYEFRRGLRAVAGVPWEGGR